MLLIIIVCAFVFAFAGLAALSLSAAYIDNINAQGKADAIALEAATLLNANDPIGQINNLISRSRLLVETSRQSLDASGSGTKKQLQSLAQFLSDQSRDGAGFMEKERQKLVLIKLDQIIQMVRDRTHPPVVYSIVPWVEIEQIRVDSLQVGTVRELNANVSAVENELYDYDLHQDYISKSSGFYRGNIDARLPGPDKDLPFNISGLPPPAGDTVSPARLIANDRFVPLATLDIDQQPNTLQCKQLPCAIQLKLVCRARDRLTGAEYNTEVIATSCTHGAQPPR
jgi:hypothetical protein